VFGRCIEGLHDTAGRGADLRSLRTPHELSDVLGVGHRDLRQRRPFVRTELQDQVARFPHLLQAAHQLHLLWVMLLATWEGRGW
jgi:hypothetical protein